MYICMYVIQFELYNFRLPLSELKVCFARWAQAHVARAAGHASACRKLEIPDNNGKNGSRNNVVNKDGQD